ncbi:hypothetical protein BJ944DRAFT_164737 [Cunninghamella echinulata]|nr:hypothetical protein BJ944DRAFT_164737 [Cunninghamella echinulata]
MVNKLFTSLFGEKVYVSHMSYANNPFVSRDINYNKDILKGLDNVEGSTQDKHLT